MSPAGQRASAAARPGLPGETCGRQRGGPGCHGQVRSRGARADYRHRSFCPPCQERLPGATGRRGRHGVNAAGKPSGPAPPHHEASPSRGGREDARPDVVRTLGPRWQPTCPSLRGGTNPMCLPSRRPSFRPIERESSPAPGCRPRTAPARPRPTPDRAVSLPRRGSGAGPCLRDVRGPPTGPPSRAATRLTCPRPPPRRRRAPPPGSHPGRRPSVRTSRSPTIVTGPSGVAKPAPLLQSGRPSPPRPARTRPRSTKASRRATTGGTGGATSARAGSPRAPPDSRCLR